MPTGRAAAELSFKNAGGLDNPPGGLVAPPGCNNLFAATVAPYSAPLGAIGGMGARTPQPPQRPFCPYFCSDCQKSGAAVCGGFSRNRRYPPLLLLYQRVKCAAVPNRRTTAAVIFQKNSRLYNDAQKSLPILAAEAPDINDLGNRNAETLKRLAQRQPRAFVHWPIVGWMTGAEARLSLSVCNDHCPFVVLSTVGDVSDFIILEECIHCPFEIGFAKAIAIFARQFFKLARREVSRFAVR